MKTIGLISANYISGDFGELAQKRTLASMPFGGRYRLIDFALSNMYNAGITTVGVISPFNSGSLIDHIGEGEPWSLDKKNGGLFIMPGSVFGVTISGNRFLMRDIIANRNFLEKDKADFVIITGSSDVYNMAYNDLIKAHKNSGHSMTIVTHPVENAEDYRGFFVTKDESGRVSELMTKSRGDAEYFMDCLIVDRKFLIDFIDWFETLEYMDLMDIISMYIDRFSIGTYTFDGYYGKVSNLKDYMRVNKDMLNRNIVKELFQGDRSVYTKIQDVPPAVFNKSSNVKNSLIGAGSEISGTVENSIIFRSCKIEKGAVVKDSIIMQHGHISKDAVIEGVIMDKYVTVSEGVVIKGGEDKPLPIGKKKTL